VARPRKDQDAPHSQTLDRGLRLLAAITGATGPVDLAMLADTVDLHRSVAYRLVRTLEDHRLVRRTADGRYEPGLGLAVLAASVSRPVQAAAFPELTRLAARARATAFLAVRDGDDAVTVASVEPPHGPAHVTYRPGNRHPVDRGAPGLALLAGARARPGERPEVAVARERGYATSRGEVIPGLESVAAPIVRGLPAVAAPIVRGLPGGVAPVGGGLPGGVVVGAVAVVVLADSADLLELGGFVVEAAAAVRTALG
jgi:DNA-binding IclR family transcriptional regulator